MTTDKTATASGGYVQPELDVRALTEVLDGEYAEVRDLVRANLVTHASVLDEADELGVDAFRERVRELVVAMAATGQTGMGFPKRYGGGGDVGASIAAFETLAFGDLSVLVKVGVQFGLFGGAILHLGTERHHDAHLPDLVTGKLMGCFAMTETGHGSHVQALGTVARYDAATREFVITTEGDQARKDYIGNAARHGELAVVFAQLEVGGTSEGVHAFVVPIRVDGQVAPGVDIEDDGRKMGLNGVDNGRIRFDGVRVPREALLNRFADVTPEGVYTSPIDNPDRRFFTMLGTLVQGRVSVGGAGVNAAKVALAVATKYALRRRQFAAGSRDEEQLLLDYGLHQRRLLPLIARTYALHFAQDVVRTQLHDVFSGIEDDPQERRRLESRAAGTKALGTWHATRVIQECREACGGAGYLAVNRFAALKADSDIFTTFEGDNHVLLQLVAKGLLTDYASEFEDWTSSAWSATSPTSPSRRSSRRRRPTNCWSGYAICCPAATSGTRRPVCSTRSTSSPWSATARSICSPGWPAGSSAGSTRSAIPASSSPRCRTMSSRWPAPMGSGWCWRPSSRSCVRCPRVATRSRWACCATCSRCRRSRRTGRGSWSTGG